MTRDYKNVTRYPAQLTQASHDAHTSAADQIVIAAVILTITSIAAYLIGYQRAEADAQAAAPTVMALGNCDPSDKDRDVLEHSFAHRGEVFYRECIVIERPNYVSPKYSARPARPL